MWFISKGNTRFAIAEMLDVLDSVLLRIMSIAAVTFVFL